MKHSWKIILLIITLLAVTACGNSRQRRYRKARRGALISTTQLGRNKKFFSKSYQNKLKRTYRKKK